MSWEIALGIFALTAFALSLIALAGKIVRPISELSGEIKLLHKSIDDLAASNGKEFDSLHRDVSDHEQRLRALEGR